MIDMMPKGPAKKDVQRIEVEPTLKEADGYKRYEPVVVEIHNYAQKDMFILLNGREVRLSRPPEKGGQIRLEFTGLYLGPGYPQS